MSHQSSNKNRKTPEIAVNKQETIKKNSRGSMCAFELPASRRKIENNDTNDQLDSKLSQSRRVNGYDDNTKKNDKINAKLLTNILELAANNRINIPLPCRNKTKKKYGRHHTLENNKIYKTMNATISFTNYNKNEPKITNNRYIPDIVPNISKNLPPVKFSNTNTKKEETSEKFPDISPKSMKSILITGSDHDNRSTSIRAQGKVSFKEVLTKTLGFSQIKPNKAYEPQAKIPQTWPQKQRSESPYKNLRSNFNKTINLSNLPLVSRKTRDNFELSEKDITYTDIPIRTKFNQLNVMENSNKKKIITSEQKSMALNFKIPAGKLKA